MGQSQGQCKPHCQPCSTADPTSDTVKVDSTLLAEASLVAQKQPAPESPVALGLEEVEAQRLEQEAKEQRRRDEEEQRRLERESEQKRSEEEAREFALVRERERERAAEEAELARRRDQEDREHRDQVAQERQRIEEAARVAAAREQAEKEEQEAQVEAQKRVDAFLKKRGFKSLVAPRKAFCGAAVYPVHLAIEEGDTELVLAMLRCGANPSQKNSAGKTARDLVERYNQDGSFDAVIVAMTAAR